MRLMGTTVDGDVIPILVDDDGKVITTTGNGNGNGGSTLECKTGVYDGDGTTDQYINGLEIQPIYGKIWEGDLADEENARYFEVTDTMILGDPQGLCMQVSATSHKMNDNKIIQLDIDGFHVDDNGGDQDPNKTGVEYHYMMLGYPPV